MNKREVFDKVAKHLLDQGKRAIRVYKCAYRGDNGLTCAIGCLIPDELYHSSMEGRNIFGLLNNYPSLMELFGSHKSLLWSLQNIHDYGVINSWESRLEEIKKQL